MTLLLIIVTPGLFQSPACRGLGTLEDNEIYNNGAAGVQVETDGRPAIRGNRITRNRQVGVRITHDGKGVVEGNDLTGNARGAWYIANETEPNVTWARNKK